MITRFAPSPTGPLHLGHAYSAILAHDMARNAKGSFLLRIEDIDTERSRKKWEDQIYEDFTWLGITWDGPVMRQSDRTRFYDDALARLVDMGLVYPCRCSRRDIIQASSAPQEGVEVGFDGPIYPGTCKDLDLSDQEDLALRVDMKKAVQNIDNVTFSETLNPNSRHTTYSANRLVSDIGDIVLARKNIGTSYHLSVVVDDHFQNITDVVRGEDLLPATPIHALLQKLLGYSTPVYHHHRLIRDNTGKRLAKRDDARSIASLRQDGASPSDICQMVGLT